MASITNDETSLALTGSNIEVAEVVSSPHGWKHGNITGTFSDMVIRTPSLMAKADQVDLNFPLIARATRVEIEGKNLSIGLPSVSIRIDSPKAKSLVN